MADRGHSDLQGAPLQSLPDFLGCTSDISGLALFFFFFKNHISSLLPKLSNPAQFLTCIRLASHAL